MTVEKYLKLNENIVIRPIDKSDGKQIFKIFKDKILQEIDYDEDINALINERRKIKKEIISLIENNDDLSLVYEDKNNKELLGFSSVKYDKDIEQFILSALWYKDNNIMEFIILYLYNNIFIKNIKSRILIDAECDLKFSDKVINTEKELGFSIIDDEYIEKLLNKEEKIKEE